MPESFEIEVGATSDNSVLRVGGKTLTDVSALNLELVVGECSRLTLEHVAVTGRVKGEAEVRHVYRYGLDEWMNWNAGAGESRSRSGNPGERLVRPA